MSRKPTITIEDLEAVYAKRRVEDGIFLGAMARIKPSWRMVDRFPGGAGFVRGGVKVLFSVMRYDDRRIWIHVSVSGSTASGQWRLPTWEEMKRAKNDFIGADRWAYQVFPDEKNYVNDNPYVLHLFSLLDGEPALPDFTSGLGIL